MRMDAAVVVIPCLNEEKLLRTSVESLGFGLQQETDGFLLIVDNGSTDASIRIAQEIQAASPPGKVMCFSEAERGYVPARYRGNREAELWMRTLGHSPNRVLVLQADADTIYSPGYVRAVLEEVSPHHSAIFESQTSYPDSFIQTNARYLELCAGVDAEFVALFEENFPRVIADDKAISYRLSDYFEWGGHRREWFSTHEEIHAESSRLLMRAMTYGSELIPITGGLAQHSIRRVIETPLRDFATAGFPREVVWRTDLCQREASESELLACGALRRRHTMALFGLLPMHVLRTMGRAVPESAWGDTSALPNRTLPQLRASPALFIEDAFRHFDLLN